MGYSIMLLFVVFLSKYFRIVFKMVSIFGLRFGEVVLEERFLFVATMRAIFRGSVGYDGIIGQYLLR